MTSEDPPKAEITKRYTLEGWRTQEVEIHDIPEAVFSTTLEDILRRVFSDIASMDQNPIELLFYCTFDHEGWRVVRTPLSRNRTVTEYFAAGIEMSTGISDELYGSGVPDFFLWDAEGQHRFVEVKASEDSLNTNQLEWAGEYDCDFYIAQLASVDPELTDEEIIEMNRIQ